MHYKAILYTRLCSVFTGYMKVCIRVYVYMCVYVCINISFPLSTSFKRWSQGLVHLFNLRVRKNPNAMKTASQTRGWSQGCFVVSSCRVSPISCALSNALISTVRRGWCLLCGWNWKWLVMEWALAAPPDQSWI